MSELGAAGAASAALGSAVGAMSNWRVAPAAGVGFACAVVSVTSPGLFLAAFLVLRPLLDGASDLTAIGGVNPAGALALFVIVSAAAVIVSRGSEATAPAGSGAFLVLIALSTFAALLAVVDFGSTIGNEPLNEIIRLAALFAMYILAHNVARRPRDVARLFALIALSALPPALVGLYEWIAGVAPNETLGFGRIDGTFFGPNPFATYLALAGLILIALPTTALQTRVRVAALVPILVALVGSYSRTGWAFFLLGLLFLEWRRRKTLVFAAILAFAILAVSVPSVRERTLSIPFLSGTSVAAASERPNSFAWRLYNWDQLLEKYSERPLSGYGLRTTEIVNPNRTSQSPDERTGANPTGYRGFTAHSSVVRALVEGGPLLLVSYVVLLASVLLALNRLQRAQWEFRAHAELLFVLWALVVIIGITSTDALNLTALLFALFALTGALQGAWVSRRP